MEQNEHDQDLLDRFAAAALTGYLATYAFEGARMPYAQNAAREVYDYAQSMMIERARRNSDGSERAAEIEASDEE